MYNVNGQYKCYYKEKNLYPPNLVFIIIFLHGLGRLTCSSIDALPSFQT